MIQNDFSARTFLERVSLASREPVYSAALAWALEDLSPLPLWERLAVLEQLTGVTFDGAKSISATTEWNRIDVLLTVRWDTFEAHIAIENKIKASEGERQLGRYDDTLGVLQGSVHKIFLTLAGEAPRSGQGWKAVSYAALHEAIARQPGANDPYVSDMCRALARLATTATSARNNDALAATVFGDQPAPEPSRVSAYVSEMRLGKVVQRIWMAELASRLDVPAPWQIWIDESHGQALLNVQAALKDTPGYLVGTQLQGRTLKVFCHPYPPPSQASSEQHRQVESVLTRVRLGLNLGAAARASKGPSRGFRSFSVAKLPEGRCIDDWAEACSPLVDRMITAFPDVQAVPQ
jgi:hypothetical protein